MNGVLVAYILAILCSSFFHVHKTVEAAMAACAVTETHWDLEHQGTGSGTQECPACVWSRVAQSAAEGEVSELEAPSAESAELLTALTAPLFRPRLAPCPRGPPLA